MTRESRKDAGTLTQYGGLFIGQRSAEVFGVRFFPCRATAQKAGRC
jgi:hypothetical protein